MSSVKSGKRVLADDVQLGSNTTCGTAQSTEREGEDADEHGEEETGGSRGQGMTVTVEHLTKWSSDRKSVKFESVAECDLNHNMASVSDDHVWGIIIGQQLLLTWRQTNHNRTETTTRDRSTEQTKEIILLFISET
jgi:hypothetical protein